MECPIKSSKDFCRSRELPIWQKLKHQLSGKIVRAYLGMRTFTNMFIKANMPTLFPLRKVSLDLKVLEHMTREQAISYNFLISQLRNPRTSAEPLCSKHPPFMVFSRNCYLRSIVQTLKFQISQTNFINSTDI